MRSSNQKNTRIKQYYNNILLHYYCMLQNNAYDILQFYIWVTCVTQYYLLLFRYIIETNNVYWGSSMTNVLSFLLYANEKSFLFGNARSITATIREIDSKTGPLNVDLKGALLKKSISALPKSWKPTRSMPRCWDARYRKILSFWPWSRIIN